MKPAGAALVCAAVSVGWNNLVLPAMGLTPRGRAIANTAFAAAVTAGARAGGLSPRELGRRASDEGRRWELAAVALPVAAYAVLLRIPQTRRRFATPERRTDHLEWVLVHIPFGTVLTEELVFRSVLYALARRMSPRWGGALGAVAFGLWHIDPARRAGDSVLGTVLFTAAAGVVFDELRRRSGSVIAPMLAHLAVNAGGAVAVRIASEPAGTRLGRRGST